MTAPDPPAMASVDGLAARPRSMVDDQLAMYEPVIRAHERAQVLAEVDAALRDWPTVVARQPGYGEVENYARWGPWFADYLRDTLAGNGGEAQP